MTDATLNKFLKERSPFRWRWLAAAVAWLGLWSLVFCLLGVPVVFADALPSAPPEPVYEQHAFHHPDGIGKVYMGREIAQVMGHRGAGWLERSRRDQEEQPQKLVAHLGLKPTDVVADIGAGTGYLSFRLAPRLPQGTVLAVDVQPEMVELLERRQQQTQITNVQPILGDETDPHLPTQGVDVVLMVDAYHEFEFPREMMQAIAQALRPEGRVVLVEYRGEDPRVLIKPLHKMTEAQVSKEMAAVGLRWLGTQKFLPQQHVLIFGKA